MSRWGTILSFLLAGIVALALVFFLPSGDDGGPSVVVPTAIPDNALSGIRAADLSGAGTPRVPYTLAPSPTPSPSPDPNTRPCLSADLTPSVRRSGEQEGVSLKFVNSSPTPCRVTIHPHVDGVGVGGTVIPLGNSYELARPGDFQQSDELIVIYPATDVDSQGPTAVGLHVIYSSPNEFPRGCGIDPDPTEPIIALRVDWVDGAADAPWDDPAGLILCRPRVSYAWFEPWRLPKCTSSDLSATTRVTGATGTAYWGIYLTNISSSTCYFEGFPQVNGVSAVGRETQLENGSICPGPSPCAIWVEDKPVRIQPIGYSANAMRAGRIEMVTGGYAPEARCAQAPEPFTHFRLYWENGSIDVPLGKHFESYQLCSANIGVYWAQPAVPPRD